MPAGPEPVADGRLLLQEHDGLVWEVREDEAAEAVPRIVAEMERQPHPAWDVILKVDVSQSHTWKKEGKDKERDEEIRPGLPGGN